MLITFILLLVLEFADVLDNNNLELEDYEPVPPFTVKDETVEEGIYIYNIYTAGQDYFAYTLKKNLLHFFYLYLCL